MATEPIIKQCPHCGGGACLNSNYSYKYCCYFIFVKCDICGAQGKTISSGNDPAEAEWQSAECAAALQAWNMRKREE